MLMFPNGSGIAMSKSPQSNGATEQIVGRERRGRVSQLAWCGGGCFDSRRRVNSTVRWLRNIHMKAILPMVMSVALNLGMPLATQNPIPADRFEELGPAHCGDNIA